MKVALPAPEVQLAYARLFSDNARSGDAKIVLADLAQHTGYYRVTSLAEWISLTGSAAGYEIHCHERNALRSVFSYITNFADLSEREQLQLERTARYGLAEE
jgi:hypothetical protein